ncbi:MAG: MBOAT family protein [Fibrobacteria bacterium]|nr:MBOAT family protein [Fibrobacteria bacterium]
MLFNSLHFSLFLSCLLLLFWAIPVRLRKPVLLFSSYYFYAAWDIRFLSLIIISSVIDLVCGKQIHQSQKTLPKRFYLFLSLSTNLGILGFFKYFNFFIDSFQTLIGMDLGLNLRIILPVGISFYTFQSMSYTIDIYRKKLEPVKKPLDFFVFVAFFPQLVAGPIVRASEFLPQLKKNSLFSIINISEGLSLFGRGFIKKVLFADSLARYIDPIFTSPLQHSSLDCLLAMYGFAFQIYWDFSGYTDMARGIARLFGYTLPINFNLPYISRSFREFWQRWHISLSGWLRDYLYIPLGGSKKGATIMYFSLFTTMLLGGLWHGASWNFVLWGMFHGILLAIERCLNWSTDYRLAYNWSPITILRILIIFHLNCLAWLVFRCKDLEIMSAMIRKLCEGPWSLGYVQMLMLFALLLFASWHVLIVISFTHKRFASHMPRLAGALSGVALALALIYSTKSGAFLYFQF